jgi:hypothetical protein
MFCFFLQNMNMGLSEIFLITFSLLENNNKQHVVLWFFKMEKESNKEIWHM